MSHDPENQAVCPMWAEELIEYLRRAEVFRGTIPDEPNWYDEKLKALVTRISGEEIPIFDEDKIEYLFKKIVLKLSDAGFGSDDIAFFINQRVKLQYGPKYCSSEEVEEHLKS